MIGRRLLRMGLRPLRAVAGRDSRIEQTLKARVRARRRVQVVKRVEADYLQLSGDNFVVVKARDQSDKRTGILLRGGCDLPSAFAAAPLLGSRIEGTLAMFKQGTGGELGAHRTDLILQSLEGVPSEETEEVRRRLRLEEHYFSPRLFEEKEFVIDGFPNFGTFPKSVVILSIGSDLVRTVYRHREHGYLVDPGGFWLSQLTDRVLPDPSIARWFKDNFEPIGRIEVEEFQRNLEEIIRLLRSRMGAHVIIYNTLVVDPGNQTHNYQLLDRAHTVRRRQFNIALSGLSSKLNFHIVDIDRILKSHGIREQVDFAHVPYSQTQPIGREVHRILQELEVV